MRWRDSPQQKVGRVRGMNKRLDEVRSLSAHVSNMKLRTWQASPRRGNHAGRESVEARTSIPSGIPVAVYILLSEVVALNIGFYQQFIKMKRLEDCLRSKASAIFKPM